MLVCPSCRAENAEDAETCSACGRSLEPSAAVALRRIERPQPVEETLDVPPPKRHSRAPLAITLIVLAGAAAGLGSWLALRPNPCQGKFSSSLFEYCAEIPQGWTGGSELAGEEQVDRFAPAGANAAAIVRVDEVVPGTETQDYAQAFRTNQEANGLDPTPIELIDLDGIQALAWDITVQNEEGEAFVERDIMFVREDGVWRITLFARQDVYPRARLAFDSLLASWHWR